jgi:hypothetical protein
VALRDAVVKAGYPCPNWKLYPKGKTSKYAKEEGHCSDADLFSVYADADAIVKERRATSDGIITLLVGPNWTLVLSDSDLEKVQAVIGGEMVDESKLPADELPPESKPEPKPAEPGIGDKVRDGDYQFTVTKIRCGVKRVGDQYYGEKAQGQFCLVSMKIKNVGKEEIDFSDENQKLYDTKGREYSPDDGAWWHVSEPGTDINPGNTLKTVVPFDIPKKAHPDHLLLKAGFWGASEGVQVKL